jgi:hypothetical protein
VEASDATQPVEPALEDLDSKTVDELRDLAEERGLEGTSKLRKDELVEALRSGEVPVTGSARVAVSYPHDEFDSGVDGVPVLTREFSEEPLSATQVEKVREAARAYGVPLREVAA